MFLLTLNSINNIINIIYKNNTLTKNLGGIYV